MLKEIGTTNQVYARRLLQCLAVAQRPLRVNELAEILAFDFVAEEGIPKLKENWRWEDKQEAVLSTCSSLVSVVGGTIVQFSHFSVKEFLTSDRLATSSPDISHFHILPEPAHTVIVKACLGILLQSGHGTAGAMDTHISSLLLYASEHWAEHARFEKVWTHVEDGIRRLFDATQPHLEAWLRGALGVRRFRLAESPYLGAPRGSPLYYASICGFHDMAALFVAENPQYLADVIESRRNLNPLTAALYNRHFDIADLLYERAADLGIITNGNEVTLLHAASELGLVDFAKWLLDHGAPANLQEHNHETALHLEGASRHRQHGIRVDTVDDFSYTSLHWASQCGHSEIVRLLLLRGADVTAENQIRRTPLHLALYSGDTETVRLLIDRGADLNARDRRHMTPLHLAPGSFVGTELCFSLSRIGLM